MTRVAIDTNVLIYSEGVADPRRHAIAVDTFAALTRCRVVIPVQVMGETLRVLVGKAKWPLDEAMAAVRRIERALELSRTDIDTWEGAKELIARNGLSVWDAVILASASQAGCALLLSEDYQNGFVWRGTTVVDPFAERRHPLLESLMTPRNRS